MGKKYLDTKEGSLEQSVLGVWQTAIEEGETRVDGRTKQYKEHRKKLESARLRREKKKQVTEASGDKEAYQKFFNATLKKFGVKSPAELKDKDKKKFYDMIDAGWEGDNEKKEELDLDEGKLKDLVIKGQDLEAYAKKSGGIDKKDMMKVAAMLKKGDKSGALKYAKALDTDPRDYILDLMDEEVELDEGYIELEFKDKRTAEKAYNYINNEIWAGGNPPYDDFNQEGNTLQIDTDGNLNRRNQMLKDLEDLPRNMKFKVVVNEEVEVKEGKMSQLHQLMKDGKTAEEIAKIMRVDAKTIKKLMASYEQKESIDWTKASNREWGTDSLRKHTEEVTPGEDGEWVAAQNAKNNSMREALAKVWGVDEGKSPFKKESKKDLTKEVKNGKTMTGKKVASVDINPTIKEKTK
jgi:hypothetical protein